MACPFSKPTTSDAVTVINAIDGCTATRRPTDHSTVQSDQLTPPEHKEEYYYLLALVLPDIVGILQRLRKMFPHGLVAYGDEDALVSSLDTLKQHICEAARTKDFLLASYWIHNAIAVSVDIATEIWAKECDWSAPHLVRLSQLVDEHRQELYGQKAAQKRISSAMIQTLHISASFERFIHIFFEQAAKRKATNAEALTLHHCSLKSAAHLTELHLERTRKVRPIWGAEVLEGGIVHRYTNSDPFILTENGLLLDAEKMAGIATALPIDTSDGRIGCPGKKHIPEIWHWIEEISLLYSYPILKT